MNHQRIKEYKALFSSDLSFEELGNKLQEIGLIESFYCDFENVYEWIAAETKNRDLALNISRKHSDGERFEIEQIHILAMYTENEPNNYAIEEIAKKIATNLKCKVSLGYITNILADEYVYKATSEIHS